MEELTATLEAPAVTTTENAEVEAKPVSTETTEPTGKTATAAPEKSAPSSDEKAYRLAELVKLTESKPETKLNDEDQAIYDEYVDNKLQPKERPAANSKDSEKEAKPEIEKAEKPEKETTDNPKVPAHIQAAMKEVGAKTPDELPAKIKELRAVASGKETKALGDMKQDMARRAENSAALIRDFAKGVPKAVQFVKENYGIDFPTQTQTVTNDSEMPFDADADLLTGGALTKLWTQLQQANKRLNEVDTGFKSHQQRLQEQSARQSATSTVVDEMIGVAGKIEGLKDLPNLRNAIIDRVVNGKVDHRLDAFNELFDIAQEAGTTLENAYLIKQGRETQMLVARAKEDGRKETFGHKPNMSLSSITTEDAEITQFTDSQVDQMEKDYRLIPDEWMNAKGELNPAKVPKKYWGRFGLE